jgi:hypothetical protein
MANQRKTANSPRIKKPADRKEARRKPGSTGAGEYYHIEVLPRTDFVTFRTQDVGRRGHIQRVAGQRSSGYWSTVKWMIDKNDAHVQDNKLVADTPAAKEVIEQLGSEPVRMLGDLFKARPRPNFHEDVKSASARTRARSQNVKAARTTRRKGQKGIRKAYASVRD